jgi:hypothetical protein
MKVKSNYKGNVRVRGENGLMMDFPSGKIVELTDAEFKNFGAGIKFHVEGGKLALNFNEDIKKVEPVKADANSEEPEADANSEKIESLKDKIRELQTAFKKTSNLSEKEAIKKEVVELKKELSSLK